jgi:hypothetical protein
MAVADGDHSAGSRRLAVWLRVIGGIDLLAAVAVVLPTEWHAAIHAELDLGNWPDAPIAAYLARSASWMYALCGALLLYLSGDVPRYRALIRFLCVCGVVTGAVLVGIDLAVGMPVWWTLTEGPGCAALAVVTWWLEKRIGNRQN